MRPERVAELEKRIQTYKDCLSLVEESAATCREAAVLIHDQPFRSITKDTLDRARDMLREAIKDLIVGVYDETQSLDIERSK